MRQRRPQAEYSSCTLAVRFQDVYDRNIACTKLPTLAEAQSYYQETSDARRSTTDLNGKLVPLIVTNWKYP